MTFAEAAMIMMSGGSANIQSLTVTKNGKYDAPEGVVGFNPVTVNVLSAAVIESITITANGTYTAPSGIDGYSPVIVNNPYEDLYKLEHGGGDNVDTGITDSDGNEIVINGNEIDDTNNLNDLISAAIVADGSVTVGVTNGTDIFSVKIELIYSIKNGVQYVDPQLTLTNLKTGATIKTPGRYPWYNQKSEGVSFGEINFKVNPQNVYFGMRYYYDGVAGVGVSLNPTLSTIGISLIGTNVKYYVLGGV